MFNQQEIDTLYFTLKNNIKSLTNVDKLNELTTQQKTEFNYELNLLEKLNKL